MLFERFKLKRKLNKFEEWCDSKNLKNKHPHYYKFFSKFADTNELSSIINTFEILENFKSKLKYLDVNPLSYNSLWDLTKDIEYIVLQQDNILNKKELISKINNVIVKEKERDTKSYFSEKDAIMYYFNFKENDYIVVSKGETTSEYNTFIHELNHLVDRHKKTKVDIVPSFILKDFDEKQFLDFGDRFFPNLIQDRKDVTREDIIYETWFFFQNNKEYLISEPELYARLSHMKSYLIDEGYMKKDEKVTKEIVSKFLEDFKQLEFKTFDYLEKLEQIDFIFYLPFIDWDKTDEFNLIVSKEFKLPESYV